MMKNSLYVLVLTALAGIFSNARASQIDELRAMAGNSDAAEAGFTGSTQRTQNDMTPGVTETQPYRKTSKVGIKVGVSVAKTENYRASILPSLTVNGSSSENKFADSLTKFVGILAGWTGIGAAVGLFVGILGSSPLIAAAVTGALIGGTVGLILGAGMLLAKWCA